MMPNGHDAAQLEELIDDLTKARQADRKLDIRLEYCAGLALADRVDAAGVLIEEGFSWDTVSEALDDRTPPYTSSIDAALPGESIVLVVRSDRRGKWGATHRDDKGREFLVWAATEAISRRLAYLTALRAAVAEGSRPAAPVSGDSEPVSEENRDWKVMF